MHQSVNDALQVLEDVTAKDSATTGGDGCADQDNEIEVHSLYLIGQAAVGASTSVGCDQI